MHLVGEFARNVEVALAAGDRFVELAEHLERVAKVTARLRLAQPVTDRSVSSYTHTHNQSHTVVAYMRVT